MQRIELKVTKRTADTSAAAIRRNGRLPGVIYGAGGENVQVDCDAGEFAYAGLGSSGAHLIRFASSDAGLNSNIALVKEIQTHPVKGTPIHVDFLRVDLNKPVDASISISLVGKAAGLIEGGIVQPLRREIEVRALPDKLPEVIEVDVTALNIHDSIHVEDIVLPEGVQLHGTSENFTIVTVLPPVVEAAPTEAEGGDEGASAAATAAGAQTSDGQEKEGD